MIQLKSKHSSILPGKPEIMANDSFNGTPGGNENHDGVAAWYQFIGPSVFITVFGTVTNLLSLSYFITQRNFNNRQSSTEIINNHLFIVLNAFDILVCVFLSIWLLARFLHENNRDNALYKLGHIGFIMSVQTTGFITCILSVIRAISIIRPRHQLNVKVLVGAIIVYCLIMIYLNRIHLELVKPVKKNILEIFIANCLIYTGMFLVVILSNIVCIAKLANSKVASWKREATINMGILSAVYCIFNIGFLVSLGFYIFKCGSCISSQFEEICMYILLPMNSASNPVVYFLRNREMRRYLKNVWRKMTCRISEQEVRPEQDMTMSNIDRTEVTEGRTRDTAK